MLLLSQIYTLEPKFTVTDKQAKESFIKGKNQQKTPNK